MRHARIFQQTDAINSLEVHRTFWYIRCPRKAIKNHEDMDNLNGYFIITIPLLRRDLYLQRRSDSSTTIIRMEMLYITAGHVFTFLNSSIRKCTR